MKITFFIGVFAFLLALSSGTSFLGYYYLSLAGEYRARKLTHLDHTQRLLTLTQSRIGLSSQELEEVRGHMLSALDQAIWCTEKLNPIETRIFHALGAAEAFQICERARSTAESALKITESGPADTSQRYALPAGPLFDLRREARIMREQSLAFQPHVGVIESNLRQSVAWGTLLTSLAIGVLFLFNAREMLKSWGYLNLQRVALEKQRRELQRANSEARHHATHDALTGLPNRRRLDSAFNERVGKNEDIIVIRLDLDHFKAVNDTAGHAAGDHVLRTVAQLMTDIAPEDALLARTGGDEFVMLMGEDTTQLDAHRMCLELLDAIQKPIPFGDKVLQVGSSFGIASSHEGSASSAGLNVAADAALYEAKKTGRNRACVYTEDLHNDLVSQRKLSTKILEGLKKSEFVPYYQPQIDAATGRLVGLEVLSRWHSDSLGIVMPFGFLPIANELNLIEAIDDQIYHRAFAEVRDAVGRGLEIEKLSFNVTAPRLMDASFIDMISRDKTDAFAVALEVLESVLIEEQTDTFKFAIDRLKDAGILIEIDDFGSGHASVVGLMQLQPDTMKIDRALVKNVINDRSSQVAIKSMIEIAATMGIEVIAEGVETLEHAEVLREMGCNTLQGFAYSKPIPIDALVDFAAGEALRFATARR